MENHKSNTKHLLQSDSKIKTLSRLKQHHKDLTNFYVFDVETGLRKNNKITWQLNARPESFIFGVIYGFNFTKVIHSLKELRLEFLKRRYKGCKVYAHNAEYDLTTVYGNIFHLDNEAIFNGKFITCSNGNCTFADSMNIYQASVKKIGEMLGKSKQGMSGGNYEFSNWNNEKEKTRDINACIRDCEIIYDALSLIFQDVGDIKITQASLSMTYYRRHFMPYDIQHNDVTAEFWESYYGGRTEAFKIGKVKAQVIDVNSMYPHAMKEAKFPNPATLKKVNKISVKKFLNQIINNYEGQVCATVSHKKCWIGYLPVKMDSKLCFPTGVFTGCWNFNEIRFALECNIVTIIEIQSVTFSDPITSPFIDFVNTLYRKRFETDNPLEIFRIKIFMNSLYGKFAQRIEEENIYIDNIFTVDTMLLVEDYTKKGLFIKLMPFSVNRDDGMLTIKAVKKIVLNYSIPSYSSYITSYARIILLKKLLEIGKKNAVYCDTDSIFFENNVKIVDEKQLGGWKLEKKIVTEIRGLKNYRSYDNV